MDTQGDQTSERNGQPKDINRRISLPVDRDMELAAKLAHSSKLSDNDRTAHFHPDDKSSITLGQKMISNGKRHHKVSSGEKNRINSPAELTFFEMEA